MIKKIIGIKAKASKLMRGFSQQKILTAKHDEQYQKLRVFAERIKADKKKIQNLKNEYNNLLIQYYSLLGSKNPYYSITPGNKELEEKWHRSPGKRVLFISPIDCAGSFMRWALAITRNSDYAVRLITFADHPYGYDVDLIFPAVNTNHWNKLIPLIQEANIIHLKDEMQLFSAFYGSNKIANHKKEVSPEAKLTKFLFESHELKNKPKIFTHYGSYARKFKHDQQYIDFVESFDARVAMTPDLNFDWFQGYFVPHPIDSNEFFYSWQDNQIIAHSPSNPEKKGTHDFLAALAKTPHYKDWTLDLIQGVSHKECLARKQKATLFFDQAGKTNLGNSEVVGFYGNSALEAMVHGIPTIAHISEQALDGAKRAGKDWSICPVINTNLGEEGIQKALQGFANMSPSERAELSKKTRLWIETHHSYQSIAKELARIYSDLQQQNLINNQIQNQVLQLSS